MTSLLDSIIDAGSQLTAEQDKNIIAEKLVLMCLHYTESDLSAFYSCLYDSSGKTELNCLYKNGYGYDFKKLITTEISVSFLIDTGKAHITGKKNYLEKKTCFLLNDYMESSIAVPLFQNGFLIGLLVLNSKQQSFYNRKKVLFLESICRLSSGLLFNLDFINPKDSNISLQDDDQFFITVDNEGRLSSISDNAGNIFSNRMIGQKAIDYLRDKIKTEDAIDFSDALLKNHSAFSCVCLSSSEEIFSKCKQIEMEIIPLIDKYNQDLGKIVFFRPLRTLKEDK